MTQQARITMYCVYVHGVFVGGVEAADLTAALAIARAECGTEATVAMNGPGYGRAI